MDPILEPQQSSVPKTKKRHYSRKRQKVVKNQSSEPPPVTGKKLGTVGCGVCNLSDARYKCPKCRLPYCTIPCWKNHQRTCPALTNQPIQQESTPSTTMIRESKYLASQSTFVDPLDCPITTRPEDSEEEDEDDEWKITADMMQRLDQSEWLRNELSDGGLRRFICDIDMAKDEVSVPRKRRLLQTLPEPTTAREQRFMDTRATHGPFANFIDRLLYTAGIYVPHDSYKCEDTNGDDDWETVKQHLVLAPIRKNAHVRMDHVQDKDVGSTEDDESHENEGESQDSDNWR